MPLPIQPFNFWFYFNIPDKLILILISLEFVFFRLFASQLIDIVILKPNSNGQYLKILTLYMKLQMYLFVLFLVAIFTLNANLIYIIFIIFYIPSLIIGYFILFSLRDSINDVSLLNEDYFIIENNSDKTTIDNIG